MDKNHEKLLKLSQNNFQDLYDVGFEYEREYRGCSQCIVGTFVKVLETDELSFLLASGHAAGIGLTTEGPCGAFTGGVMIIGNYFGRSFKNKEEIEKLRYCSKLVREFREKFIEEYGSTRCKEIQSHIFGRSYNLLDTDDFAAFEEAGAHVDKCPDVVGRAAQWVGEILLEEYEKSS